MPGPPRPTLARPTLGRPGPGRPGLGRRGPGRPGPGRPGPQMPAPDGVHPIRLQRSWAYLLDGPELTLIDAGLPGSRPAIEKAIRALGRDPADLTRILCTHAHPDHAGGAADFDDNPRVTIHLHPDDAQTTALRLRDAARRPSRPRLFAAATPRLTHAQPLHDGDELPVLGG